jgi:hypothetical protein
MWRGHLRAHRDLQKHPLPLEDTMHQHHAITAQLVDVRRRDLQADADRHRRIRRRADRTHRTFARR